MTPSPPVALNRRAPRLEAPLTSLLLCLLLAFPLETPAPPSEAPVGAVFYWGGRTWLVDLAEGALLVAPGMVVAAPEGLWRLVFKSEGQRVGEPPAPSHATRLIRLSAGGEAVALTPPAPKGPAQDEWSLLSAQADRLTLAHHQRHHQGAPRPVAEAATFFLPGGERAPVAPAASPAVEWLSRRIPGLIDPCVKTPTGQITLERPGGVQSQYLVLGPSAPSCAGQAHALSMAEMPPDEAAPAAAEKLWSLPDATDVRVAPSGEVGLVLTGGERGAPAVVRDLLSLTDPCALGTLFLWRAGGPLQPIGQVGGLTGARFLAEDDPLWQQARARFTAAQGGACFLPARFDDGRTISRASARLCQLEERGRGHRSLADLGASVRLLEVGDTVELTVFVTDDAVTSEDAVTAYMSGGPKSLIVSLSGVRGELKRGMARAMAYAFEASPDGYRVDLKLPKAWLGNPPALSVAVDDQDPGLPGRVRLWAAGAPVDSVRQRPTPVEGQP